MYQRTQLIGHIGQIKDTRFTPSGTAVTQYTVATSKSILNKLSEEWEDVTEWHTCVSFKKCAEHIRDKLRKGDLILVEGEHKTSKYKDQQSGQPSYHTDLVVMDFPKKLPKFWVKNGQAPATAEPGHQPIPQTTGQQLATQEPSQTAGGPESFGDFPDDDIPF